MPDTVRAYFEMMPNQFRSEAASGMTATYQFNVTGDAGGKWFAQIEKGALTAGEGEAEDPGVTITVSDSDWLDIVAGKLDGQMAFMTGKLRIKGDMSLAMKLRSLFL